MFKEGDRVIIKYHPPLYMRGYIDYALPTGTVVHVFDKGDCLVAMNGTGDEFAFDDDQLVKEEDF